MGIHLFAGGWKGIKKKFNGETYYRESGNHTKSKASSIATHLRGKGYKVRTVKESHRGYCIYTKPVSTEKGVREL